jgi:hypothetical protein
MKPLSRNRNPNRNPNRFFNTTYTPRAFFLTDDFDFDSDFDFDDEPPECGTTG